ncbi:MAG: methylmalonyl Co-A mutase-associated GTPase MeaB [Acidimicrobiia bacterium]
MTDFEEGIVAGDRALIARAITLLESSRHDHQEQAQELLVRLLPRAGEARRVGISGVPGAGKSTLIDTLGTRLTADGHKVAVLAVDPSSSRSGGSILGDKTRMSRLAVDPAAFIRPSPTSGTLGGVTRSTREAMVVVEAAGYDVVIVETVGVGQSEVAVANMVDCFVLLTLARTGDALQGIKRGVLELADVVAVNKADGPHVADAEEAAGELSQALALLGEGDGPWSPPVLTISAATGHNLDRLWGEVERHRATLEETGELTAKRQRQQVAWMWSMVHERLLGRFRSDPGVRARVPDLEASVREGATTPALAAAELLGAADSSRVR